MGIKDLVFPKKCLSCGKAGRYLCAACIRKQERVFQICPICFRKSFVGKTHFVCGNNLSLDGLFCPFYYEGLIRRAILSLKYKFAEEITSELSFWTSYFVRQEGLLFRDFILLSVPSDKKRKNWRGFNQSENIGRKVATELDLKFSSKLLVKKKHTPPQTGLKKKERIKNLRGVFDLDPKYREEDLSSYRFLVFDDVWTTGSTIKEITRVLKKNNARQVVALTIAR